MWNADAKEGLENLENGNMEGVELVFKTIMQEVGRVLEKT